MFTRGYSNGTAVTVGYKYEPYDPEEEMEFSEKKLDHKITCSSKTTTLLKNWLHNSLIGFGILSVGMLAVSLVYVTLIFLMGGFF